MFGWLYSFFVTEVVVEPVVMDEVIPSPGKVIEIIKEAEDVVKEVEYVIPKVEDVVKEVETVVKEVEDINVKDVIKVAEEVVPQVVEIVKEVEVIIPQVKEIGNGVEKVVKDVEGLFHKKPKLRLERQSSFVIPAIKEPDHLRICAERGIVVFNPRHRVTKREMWNV